MKLLIVSDSHGNTSELQDLYTIYNDCDIYLHAGDSEDTTYSLFPFETVKGNCDYYPEMYLTRIFHTPFGKLFMAHKPNVAVPEDCKIFVHGHTHKFEVTKNGNTIVICPGSISFSRDKEGESYLIVDTNEECVTIYRYLLVNKRLLSIYKMK